MQIIHSKKELTDYVYSNRIHRIGFVPTMGALHKGHLELVRQSLKSSDITIVSIFVNPLQFGPNEDFSKYPRDLIKDARLLEELGTNAVFYPSVEEMYPEDRSIQVTESRMSRVLCGMYRDGHFDGVCTVVAKLFNLVKPNLAFFGEKDYQQLCIVKQMVRDLNFDIEIVGLPTVREADGLAMSSRNQYLSDDERRIAPNIYGMLLSIVEAWKCSPATDSSTLIQLGKNYLAHYPSIKLQYLEIRDSTSLAEVTGAVPLGSRLLVAAYLGKTRLIDNIRLS